MALAFDGLIADIRAEAQHEELIALTDEVEVLVATARDFGAGRSPGGSYPLLTMAAVLTAGWLMERLGRAIDAGEGEGDSANAGRRAAIEYFMSVVVPEALGLGAGAAARLGSALWCSGGGTRLGAFALDQARWARSRGAPCVRGSPAILLR